MVWKSFPLVHQSCIFCTLLPVLHVFSACVVSVTQLVKGKGDVFHSPEPQLSKDTVNHARVVVTSGRLGKGGF